MITGYTWSIDGSYYTNASNSSAGLPARQSRRSLRTVLLRFLHVPIVSGLSAVVLRFLHPPFWSRNLLAGLPAAVHLLAGLPTMIYLLAGLPALVHLLAGECKVRLTLLSTP